MDPTAEGFVETARPMAAPAMSSGKLENGIRCSSHPLSTTGCVARFGNISPAEMGRSELWLNGRHRPLGRVASDANGKHVL